MQDKSSLVATRYVLGELIGRGGMAEVRAGHDSKLGRNVAIKVLNDDLADDDTMREGFAEEARLAARLMHPNVVAVHDTGEHQGLPFIVMERLSGQTLADEMRNGPMPIERVRTIALQCLSALDCAHRDNIVHSDIKPANILVSDDGHMKLADFGIAKAVNGSEPVTAETIYGTPTYLAPERIDGEPSSVASDLYSFGVVLYEMLAGQPPFVGDNPITVLDAVKRNIPKHIRKVRHEVDGQLADAVMKAIAKKPADRFVSAAEMREQFADKPITTSRTRFT